jgi:hypothetical protein
MQELVGALTDAGYHPQNISRLKPDHFIECVGYVRRCYFLSPKPSGSALIVA